MANPRGATRQTDFYAERFDYDGSGNMIYYGAALPGSANSDLAWQVQKLEYDGSGNLLSVTYANGSFNYDQAWDDRAGLSYS